MSIITELAWKRIVISLGVQERNTVGVLFVRRGFSFEEQQREMKLFFNPITLFLLYNTHIYNLDFHNTYYYYNYQSFL